MNITVIEIIESLRDQPQWDRIERLLHHSLHEGYRMQLDISKLQTAVDKLVGQRAVDHQLIVDQSAMIQKLIALQPTGVDQATQDAVDALGQRVTDVVTGEQTDDTAAQAALDAANNPSGSGPGDGGATA